MYFYGSHERKHILLGTHTGKPLLVAKSRSAHLLRPFHSIYYSSAHQAEEVPSPGRQKTLERPSGKEHGPSKLLLLGQALFNVEEIGII